MNNFNENNQVYYDRQYIPISTNDIKSTGDKTK